MSEKQFNQQPSEAVSSQTGQDARKVAASKLAQNTSQEAIAHVDAEETAASQRKPAIESEHRSQPAAELESYPSEKSWATMTREERTAFVTAKAAAKAAAANHRHRLMVVPNDRAGAMQATGRTDGQLAPAALEAWPEVFEHDEMFATMRQNRRRRFFGKLALFVGVPTLLTALYVFVWATPRYVSEFEITFQTYQNTQSLSSGLIQSVMGGSSAGQDFGSILYEYARSETLLHKIDKKLNLRKYYSSSAVDYPVRLNPNASEEAFLNYYRQHIVDVSEGLGGFLTVDVQAFDPQFAQTVANAIVEDCDEMVDQMTSRARLDGMKFAEEEVARQEQRVLRAAVAQTKFQNLHGDINPTNTASQFGQIVATLEGDLAQAKTSLANTLSYATPDSPQARRIQNQITALEAQLREQRNRLTGGDATYSQILEDYSRIQLEQQFAQNAYTSAQQGLMVARADAARKQSYLVDFIKPSLPDRPARSFYTTFLAAAFIGSLLLYGIGSLVAGAFRDQSGL
jgi:capsular polysaccharide transport system permease protein